MAGRVSETLPPSIRLRPSYPVAAPTRVVANAWRELRRSPGELGDDLPGFAHVLTPRYGSQAQFVAGLGQGRPNPDIRNRPSIAD